MLTTLVLGSFIVPIMYVVYMAESDILATRPGALALVFVVSAIAGIPVSAGLQALVAVDWYSFGGAFLIAAIEEPIKVIAVLWFLRRSTNRFRMDGLVFGAAAGMGFAAFETLLFGIGYNNAPRVLVEALAVRSILAPFGHGTWTAITCAVIWGQNTRGRLYDWRVIGAFALTITLHGLWDWQPLSTIVAQDGIEFFTWYSDLPWFLGIGIIGVLILRFLVNRAAQEEVQSIVSLNPELVLQRGGRTSARGVKCQRCEQVAPAGAHYCVRCGAVLRVEQPAPPPPAAMAASAK
jgi:RsiW-degrading membrane proteinase PrsW (M82 family)